MNSARTALTVARQTRATSSVPTRSRSPTIGSCAVHGGRRAAPDSSSSAPSLSGCDGAVGESATARSALFGGASSATSGSAIGRPATARPVTSRSATAGPAASGSATAKPTTSRSATARPAESGSAAAGSAAAGPATSRSATAGPATSGSATARPVVDAAGIATGSLVGAATSFGGVSPASPAGDPALRRKRRRGTVGTEAACGGGSVLARSATGCGTAVGRSSPRSRPAESASSGVVGEAEVISPCATSSIGASSASSSSTSAPPGERSSVSPSVSRWSRSATRAAAAAACCSLRRTKSCASATRCWAAAILRIAASSSNRANSAARASRSRSIPSASRRRVSASCSAWASSAASWRRASARFARSAEACSSASIRRRSSSANRRRSASRRLRCSRCCLADALQRVGDVPVEVGITADPHCVDRQQRVEVVGERLGGGQGCVLDQDRHDRSTAAQRVPELHPDEVAGAVEPARPRRPDHRHDHVDLRQPLVDHLGEARSGGNRVDVAEHVVLTERADQLVVEPSGEVRVVRPPVGHEQPHHHARLIHSKLVLRRHQTVIRRAPTNVNRAARPPVYVLATPPPPASRSRRPRRKPRLRTPDADLCPGTSSCPARATDWIQLSKKRECQARAQLERRRVGMDVQAATRGRAASRSGSCGRLRNPGCSPAGGFPEHRAVEGSVRASQRDRPMGVDRQPPAAFVDEVVVATAERQQVP